MNDVLRVIRDLLCYCGVSKSDYNSVKKEAYVSNFTIWKYLHLLMTVVYAFSFSFSMLSGSFDILPLHNNPSVTTTSFPVRLRRPPFLYTREAWLGCDAPVKKGPAILTLPRLCGMIITRTITKKGSS